jgi:hypothetical protein
LDKIKCDTPLHILPSTVAVKLHVALLFDPSVAVYVISWDPTGSRELDGFPVVWIIEIDFVIPHESVWFELSVAIIVGQCTIAVPFLPANIWKSLWQFVKSGGWISNK